MKANFNQEKEHIFSHKLKESPLNDHGTEDAESSQLLCEGNFPTYHSWPFLENFSWP
jgi:hypothetical protein